MAEISSLRLKLAALERERRELDQQYRNAHRQIADLEATVLMKDAEMSELKQRLLPNGSVTSTTRAHDYEVDELRKTVDALMILNDDKEHRLDDMQRLVQRYKWVDEGIDQSQGRKGMKELLQATDDYSSFSVPIAKDTLLLIDQVDEGYGLNSPSATSTPVYQDSKKQLSVDSDSLVVPRLDGNVRKALGMAPSNSCENLVANFEEPLVDICRTRHVTDGAVKGHYVSAYGGDNGMLPTSNAAAGMVNRDGKKRHGLRRIFGRLRRSGSQVFERTDEVADCSQFRRGGVRATATARLVDPSHHTQLSSSDTAFARWDGDRVTGWMNSIGLNMYVTHCKRWVRNGEQLLKASPLTLEKEFGMKNALHRKKLQLALHSLGRPEDCLMSLFDHNSTVRWLDDVGLPQYKDSFYVARVDGRMLNFLTVDDLLLLKVTNELHHISLKRGIEVLRLNQFNLTCLLRRPFPEECNKPMLRDQPGQVMLWTNHRIMEWLRTIDLSEYAPNLRGSGVHGGLMVLEPRFNAELFAVLLSIQPSKTLLRRHLSTHFVSIIGPDVQISKRDFESSSGYQPLLSNTKVKRGKPALFFSHKRIRPDYDTDCFLCPLDNGMGTVTTC